MSDVQGVAGVSKGARWGGMVVGGLAGLFLLLDAAGKLARVEEVVEGTVKIGYPETVIVPLGVVLLACTVLYLVPRTAVLGAVLLTGFLGGAVATHVRIGDPLWTHVLFPVYMGVMVWLGLYLRDPRVRAVVPFRV